MVVIRYIEDVQTNTQSKYHFVFTSIYYEHMAGIIVVYVECLWAYGNNICCCDNSIKIAPSLLTQISQGGQAVRVCLVTNMPPIVERSSICIQMQTGLPPVSSFLEPECLRSSFCRHFFLW